MQIDIKVLLDRALPFERAGDWQGAIAVWEEVFSRSVRERDLPNMLEAVVRIGLWSRHIGDSEHAEDQLELAYVLAQLQGDNGRAGRSLNGLATLFHMHGRLTEAEERYQQAWELATSEGDDLTSGNIDQNLGALATVRGDPQLALRHYLNALLRYRTINHERNAAGVLNNLGMMYTDLHQFDEARKHLDEALAIATGLGDVVIEGLVYLNRAEMFIATGDLARARTSCDDAYEIVSRIEDHSTRLDVLKLYGIIYRESEKYHLAEVHLREAVEVASANSYPLEEAAAQRELALVLRKQGRNREALTALNRSHELFSLLQAKRWQADIKERIDTLQDDFLSLVRAWGESIEAKDRYTSGHCERVADYACRIAAEVGFDDADIAWFRMGAFLHDLGKTEIAEEVLNKPGKLTPVERELIERHPIIGDEILSPIEFPWDIRPMVRSHHERWDGKGYPDGLSGEDIPLTARILRVADVYDALTTTRSYRPPMQPAEALRIMQEDQGSFDPAIFDVFVAMFDTIRQMAGQEFTPTGPEIVPDEL